MTSTDRRRDLYGKARVNGGQLVLSRNKVAVGEPVAEKGEDEGGGKGGGQRAGKQAGKGA